MTWSRIGAGIAGAIVLGAAAISGCGGDRPVSGAEPTTPSDRTRPEPPGQTPSRASPTGTPTADATSRAPVRSCAERALDELSLRERVGQLFMGRVEVDVSPAFVPAALEDVRVGSVVLVGQATDGVDTVSAAVDRARTVAGSPAGVEPIVAVDQEGGRVQHLQGPGFERMPSAAEQAQLPPEELRANAREWGGDLRSAGVDLNLAPVADVVPESIGAANEPVGALGRGYGPDAGAVAEHVAAYVAGMADSGVASAVKHFPGLGKVRGNTDFSSGVVDTMTTRDDPDLAPFRAGVNAGARFLMVSLATYAEIDAEQRAVFSPTVIGGMVRGDLGFDGVVLSDDLGVAQEVSAVPPQQRALDFLRAGGDIVVVVGTPTTLLTMVDAVLAEAESDSSFRSLVDQSAMRVLTVKQQMRLLSCEG